MHFSSVIFGFPPSVEIYEVGRDRDDYDCRERYVSCCSVGVGTTWQSGDINPRKNGPLTAGYILSLELQVADLPSEAGREWERGSREGEAIVFRASSTRDAVLE